VRAASLFLFGKNTAQVDLTGLLFFTGVLLAIGAARHGLYWWNNWPVAIEQLWKMARAKTLDDFRSRNCRTYRFSMANY